MQMAHFCMNAVHSWGMGRAARRGRERECPENEGVNMRQTLHQRKLPILTFAIVCTTLSLNACEKDNSRLGHSAAKASISGNCSADIDLIGFDKESVRFRVSVDDCEVSSGEYDFNTHYIDSAGRTDSKVWARHWSHATSSTIDLTEYPPKAPDEAIDDIDGEVVTRCVCEGQ
jgi:hypothetical protein